MKTIIFKHGAGPTNCYLKLLQQGEVGSISGYFTVLAIVHLLII